MDLHQFFRNGVTGTEISCNYSQTTTPAASEWIFGAMKFDLGSSPNSPLSSHLDRDTFNSLTNSQEQCCTTENRSGVSPSHNSSLEINSCFYQISPSQTHPPDNLQPDACGSSLKDANCDLSMKHALQELETVLMDHGTDKTELTTPSASFDGNTHLGVPTQRLRIRSQESFQVSQVLQPQLCSPTSHRKLGHEVRAERHHIAMELSQGGLKQVLIDCATALSGNRINDFDQLIKEARNSVSISGEPVQRLGAYMVEGLVARKEESGTNIYRALRCKEPQGKDLLSYMRILYEICPYYKFGYMAANGAIAEAFKNEDRVHIIDFQIAQGTQWMTLLQALAARPSGPPHVRITGIDDPVSQYARGENLEAVGKRLAALSEEFKIPVEFHALPVFGPEVTRDMLDVRPGEALAVNFTLQLHHTPDESVDVNNPRDGLLRMVKSLSPKVTTLVEQESNTNTTPFLMRFVETLDYYSAMFESIDVTLPRDSKERIHVEQQCLARDIVNIVACEGKERVERHELLGKWKSRLTMAGFRPFPLSAYVNHVIRNLLRSYSEHYTLVEKDGTMLLGWKERNLISASAWQ